MSGGFASKIGLEMHGRVLGLLHDLGKATKVFDSYIRSSEGLLEPDADDYVNSKEYKGKIDHSSAGAQVIYRYFSDKGPEGSITAQILSLTLASHHSGLIDCLTPAGEDNYTERMNKSDEATRVNEALGNFESSIKQDVYKILADKSFIDGLNQKILSLRDKDSTETMFFKIGLLVKYLFSCLIDADRLNTADFEMSENAAIRHYGHYKSWDVLAERLEKELSRFGIRNDVDSLRRDVSRQCLEFSTNPKGLYQLTVPTGGGKTLSSLRFALNHAKKHEMDRIIYVIPFTSIIDQNAQKAREILEDKNDDGSFQNDIVLEHHSNLTPDEESTKQRLLSENWDSPIIFTTMVQFLETFFAGGTRSIRRMHQLAGSVIIFDEIQTLPIKCIHLFNLVVRFLIQGCGSTVVLCTATQPLLGDVKPEQRALSLSEENQIVKNYARLFQDLKRVEACDKTRPEGWSEEEVCTLVREELEISGSVLIVVNTKSAAINLFNRLHSISGASIYHLSTGMCPAHRMAILDKIKAGLDLKTKTICISTQLIEAGVDIDFGSVIRYLAGLDSIAQAAGRCNRNGFGINGSSLNLGRVHIVNPINEKIDRLKDIQTGKLVTERILGEYKKNPKLFNCDIIGPLAIKQYYKYYFYARMDQMDYPVSSRSSLQRSDALFNLLSMNTQSSEGYSRNHKGASPLNPLRHSFKTAANEFSVIDANTRGIIVPYGEGRHIIDQLCSVKDLELEYQLLKKAQRYSVNIFSNVFGKLLDLGVIHETQRDSGIYYLDDTNYSENFGVSLSQVNDMESLI